MQKAEKLKDYKAIRFKPGFVSEKKNGIHGTYDPQIDTIYSRTPRKILGLNHITKALSASRNLPGRIQGEIVVPGKTFEESSGLIRNYDPVPNAEFHIFNSLSVGQTFQVRLAQLKSWYYHPENHSLQTNKIYLIPFLYCRTKLDFDRLYKMHIKHGAEGACLIWKEHRNQPGKRTWDWMRRVPFNSCEAIIVDILPGTSGKKYENSLGAFKCRMEGNDKIFKVGIFKGFTDEWRQHIYNNAESYLGEMCTIEYKNLTTKGLPYQPRFTNFRWDK